MHIWKNIRKKDNLKEFVEQSLTFSPIKGKSISPIKILEINDLPQIVKNTLKNVDVCLNL